MNAPSWIPEVEAERPFLLGGAGEASYGELRAAVAGEAERLRAAAAAVGEPECCAVSLGWELAPLAQLFACWETGTDVSLCGEVAGRRLAPFRKRAGGALFLLRSGGTTGKPVTVVHSHARFLRDYRVRLAPPLRELILYAPDHIAGVDALMRAVSRGATLVRANGTGPRAVAEALERYRVEVLPATPSFLQFLLLSGELAGRDLGSVRVIPHGAEPMPAPLREAVQAVFPQAELQERFGLTETGPLPVESDAVEAGRLRLRDEGEGGYAWQVVDGELWIRSPRRMLGTLEGGLLEEAAGGWYRTGDRATAEADGSIRILGRERAMINVGGEKVQPEEVEGWLLGVEGICDVAVRGERHGLTGQAVVADVVLAGGSGLAEVRRRARQVAREAGRPLVQVPSRWEAVESIGRTERGKRLRGAES